MKKQIQYIKRKIFYPFLVILISLTSCDNYLVEVPYSVITDNQIEDSNAGADLWVTGTYNALNRMFVYDEFPRCIEFDNDYISGPSWAFDEAGSGNFQGSTLQVDPAWKLKYELINRANEAIYHIQKMKNVSEDHKNNALGELYFLKAHSYFMLVRLYGAIPVYKESINQGNQIKEQRQTIPVVYDHIISLLSDAKVKLYRNDSTAFKTGHVCAGSAASLLSKVYLTIASSAKSDGAVNVKGGVPFDADRNLTNWKSLRFNIKQVAGYEAFDPIEYYTKAMNLSDSVIKKYYGNHELLPYETLWSKTSKQDSREFLFGVNFVSGDDQLGALFPSRFCGQVVNGVIPSSGGGLWFGMRAHWYKLFEEDKDLRASEGVLHRWVRESDDKFNGGSYYPNTNIWSTRARGFYMSAKDTIFTYTEDGVEKQYEKWDIYNDGRTYSSGNGENYLAFLTKYSDVTNPALVRTDGMYPFLRFADVLLIYAEASNEVNRVTSEGLEAYNKVRRRSGATEKTMTNISTQTAFRSAIIEERAMEFALEAGDRRFDLIRLGIYLDVMNAIGGLDEANNSKVRENKHLLYPIPQDEMVTNTAITGNNTGWN